MGQVGAAGEVEQLHRTYLLNEGSVMVRQGFRYAQNVTAFQHVPHGQLIGQVSHHNFPSQYEGL